MKYDTPESIGLLAALAAGASAALSFIAFKLVARKRKTYKEVSTRGQRNELRAWGKVAEQKLGWPGLASFLDVIALGESGWRLRPRSEVAVPGSNDAVGPYQIRPTSAGDGASDRDRYRADPARLQEAGLATVAIVDFLADNLRNTPHATWEELRASAAFPFFVRGRPTSVPSGMSKSWTVAKIQKRYDDSIGRFHKHLSQARSNLNPRARAWAGPKRVNFQSLASSMGVKT